MAAKKRTTTGPEEARTTRQRVRSRKPSEVSAMTGADAHSMESTPEWSGSVRESEERFRKIFENAATGIAITDWQGRFQQCNPAYSALLGHSEQELREINFASLVHPEDREANLAELRRLQSGEVPSFDIENRYVHKDGQPVWVHKFVSVLPDETGKPAHLLALVTDITERRRAEAALRESEEKLRLFIEHAPAALAMFDRQMRYLAVSRRWLADYCVGDKKIIGRSHYEVFPDIPERWREANRRGLEGEVVRSDEDFFPSADGKNQCLRWEVRPWNQADGTIGGIVILTEDLSARKQAEEALVQSEQRFRLMADHAPVMIWMSGTDKLCTWFNKPWLAFVGRPMGRELGYGWCENAHPQDFDRCLQTYTAAFDARQPFTMEYRLKRHDGEYRWLLDNGIPVHSACGEFTGYIGSCIDITERRKAEELAATTYRHFKLAMSAARMATWVWYPDKEIASNTENLHEIYGVSAVEGIEHRMALVHPEDRRRHRKTVADALDHGTPYQSVIRIIRPDNGQVVWLDERAAPVTDSEGHLIALSGVVVDITDRKRAESALHASEERLRAILHTAGDAIITMDIHGIIRSVNPASARMFGYAADEMVGHNVGLIMPSPYREEHDGYLRRYLQTGEEHIIGAGRELFARRKDGSVFPMHLVVSETEERKLFTGILRDMTEYKRLEREVVEVASKEQQRIGQDLHDSVAQELTAVNLLAGTLAESLETHPAKAAELIQRMQQGLRRSQQELRAVLRGLLPVAVEGNGLMAALMELADGTCNEGPVTCTFDCPEPVAVTNNLTATHLYLIAQEAVHNAVKHGKPRNVRISLHANPELMLRVQCDGIGMPSRPEAKMGLGMRIMRNRAAIIGAHLTIEPAAPSGTMVTCRLLSKEP